MNQHRETRSGALIDNSLFVRNAELKDGTIVVLRSLQKEDESLVSDMFASCSGATLHQRFHYSFKLTPQWIADRCQIQVAQEVAIVAEVSLQGVCQLVGLSRLVSSPDHESAEFAILITDDWQGKGLGTLMTCHCLEVARIRGVKRVTAVTTPDNHRMIHLFRKMEFAFDYDWANGSIRVHKELTGASRLFARLTMGETRLKRPAETGKELRP